jgi:hypothetical protein
MAASGALGGTKFDPPMLPEIAAFLSSHKEFGQPISTQSISDWNKGKRQSVGFRSGRNLLFYTGDGKVVTVYEDLAGVGRTKIWGEYAEYSSPTPAPRAASEDLPAYTVLFSAFKLGGGGKQKFGDILVPSLSLKTTAKDRERIARRIAAQESLEDVTLYCTQEAYEANMSYSYDEAHPGAFRKGFLGKLEDGTFRAGEVSP